MCKIMKSKQSGIFIIIIIVFIIVISLQAFRIHNLRNDVSDLNDEITNSEALRYVLEDNLDDCQSDLDAYKEDFSEDDIKRWNPETRSF
jgi:hypothetical protein